MNDASGVPLSTLLAEFDQQTLAVLTAPTGLDTPVRSITLTDVGPGAGATAGSLHLASVTHESSAEISHLMNSCVHAEATGLILRRSTCTPEVVEMVRRESSLAVLHANDSVSWSTLFSRLTAAFAGLSQVAEISTLEVPLGDLFALANAIASRIGGATAIEDVQRHILAYSTLRGQDVDEIRQEGILGRQVPSFPGDDEMYRQMWHATKAIRVVTEYQLPRICIAVRVGAEPLGSIWVIEGEHTFDDDAFATLNQAATVAAVHLMRYRHGSGLIQLGRATLLLAQLSGEAHPSTLRQIDMDPRDQFGVIAYRVPDNPPEMVVDRITALIQFSGRDPSMTIASAALTSDTIAALVSDHQPIATTRLQTMAHTAVNRVQAATGISIVAVVSTVSNGAVGIPAAAKQVRQALRTIDTEVRAAPSVVACDSIAATLYLLSVSESSADIASPYRETISHIQGFDSQHGTSYLQTLQALFTYTGDISAIAAKLNVHRNTLRYRIRRIDEIFHIDLNDPDTRLALWLALRLRELGDNANQPPENPIPATSTPARTIPGSP
jgi:hypothetical protein